LPIEDKGDYIAICIDSYLRRTGWGIALIFDDHPNWYFDVTLLIHKRFASDLQVRYY